MDKLDPGVKIILQESFGDLETTIRESITKLQPRNEYTVLVAGKIIVKIINRIIQSLPKHYRLQQIMAFLSGLRAMWNKYM